MAILRFTTPSRLACLRTGIVILVLALGSSACANLARVKDESIPRLLDPLEVSEFKDLLAQLQSFTDMQALRATRGLIQFIDAESRNKYRTADMQLVLQRPDKIRLIVQYPITGTKIADMVSESNRFKVAVFPTGYRRFLTGTNDGDYTRWREKLGAEGRSAFVSARPFHFTEALLMRPLKLGEPGFSYGIEEVLVEEPDVRPDAKKNSIALRSFYVISEMELSNVTDRPSRVRRRFWFDRANKSLFSRQQIFDNDGLLVTELLYSDFERLSAETTILWPAVILVSRPHDGYSARLTFSAGRFEINPSNLTAQAFTLENSESLPETDLDAPVTP